VSVVLACSRQRFRYLHRGTGSIAFRVPKSSALRTLLAATGPLVAPSANRAGEPSCRTIAEARAVFGTAVDMYVPSRARSGAPSAVIQVLRS
jgi:tRNA A37 threonylcarbamoyladenosine synthetase subunit TsaC/SUA5/YrdC